MNVLSLLLNIELLNFEISNQELELELKNSFDKKQVYELYLDNHKNDEVKLAIGENTITVDIEQTMKLKNIILKNKDNQYLFPLVKEPPNCDLSQNAFINEINIEEDFIEIYLPQKIEYDFLYLEIDQKKIPVPNTAGLHIIKYQLPRSSEQISLKLLNKTLDGICYQNQSITESELNEQNQFTLTHETNCITTEAIPKKMSLIRTNYLANINTNNYKLSLKSTPNSLQSHFNKKPYAEISVINQDQNQINLSAEESNDPNSDKLKYHWELNNKLISNKTEILVNKTNSNQIINLTVEDPLKMQDTTQFTIPKTETTSSSKQNRTTKNIHETPQPIMEMQNIQKTNTINQTPNIKIINLLANPSGKDQKQEWIELKNLGTESISTTIQLKDTSKQIETIQIKNLKPQASIKHYLNKITLNNQTEELKLVYNEQIIQEIQYHNAQEGQIINPSKTNSQQQEEKPNKNKNTQEENTTQSEQKEHTEIQNSKIIDLKISEIYPNPNANEKEWIEIYNNSNQDVNNFDFQILINNSKKKNPTFTIPSKAYKLIEVSRINNQEAQISLKQGDRIIDQINYSKSLKGESFSKINQIFYWTKVITPGEKNPIFQELNGTINSIEDQTFELNKQKIIGTIDNKFLNQKLTLQILKHNSDLYLQKIISIEQKSTTKISSKTKTIIASSLGIFTFCIGSLIKHLS